MVTFLFGISMGEIIIVFLVVLLLFGANKIPEFARMLGKGMNEFRKAAEDIKKEFNESTSDLKEDLDEARHYISEQGREMKEDIKRAGEDVKQTFEDEAENESLDKDTDKSSDDRNGVDEVSKDVYGLSDDGKRDEMGPYGEEYPTADERDREKNDKSGSE